MLKTMYNKKKPSYVVHAKKIYTKNRKFFGDHQSNDI